MKTLLLIDAYAMIYRAYYAFIKVPRINSKGQNTSAIYGFLITLDELLRKVNPTHVAVAFDPHGKTFRHEAFEKYKAQRTETPEDIRAAVPWIKQILDAMNIAVLEKEGFEADDVIGTIAKQAAGADFEVLMATPDKDYGQLVDDHIFMYRPRHTGGFEKMGVKEVCEKYGITHQQQVIDLLGLMGDASDNIPGCAGVGEKTAVKLLQEFGSIDNLLAHTDQLKGALRQKVETQREQILFSRFLATIRTDVPIEWNEQMLIRQDADLARLLPLYEQLEFRSLIKKYSSDSLNTQLSASASNNAAQPTLFDAPAENPPQTPEIPAAPEPVTRKIEVKKVRQLPAGLSVVAIHVDSTKVQAGRQLDLFTQVLHQDEQLSVVIAVGKEAVYEGDMTDEVLQLLADSKVLKVGYDLKNDFRKLFRHGIEFSGPMFDVTVAHYVLRSELTHDIDILSENYLHAKSNEDEAQRTVAALQLQPLLLDKLHRSLTPSVADRLCDLEMALIPVLAKMEEWGVRFDTKILRSASSGLRDETENLEKQIKELAGIDFNVNSPKQTGEVLFETLRLDEKAKKTKGGQYVTSEEVLLSLRQRHPIVDKILEYRELKKLLSTYIDALPELINPETGKIHTTYNQTVTSTGRLSSSNPNLQNLPIRSERGKLIREAVVPDAGCLLLSADYSQIELRLMAHFSQDQHLLEAFRAGQDIHAATAAKIFACSLEEVTKDMRRKAKTANFGIIYGISAFGLAQQLSVSRAEAKQLIDDYFASFPAIVEFINRQQQLARERGYAETMFGRRRYLPDINSHNATVRAFAERNAVNAPIQGTAADIIKLAMVNIDRRLTEQRLTAQMIMQVHDELNFNVPVGEVDTVRDIVVSEMQNAVSLSVPLVADCGVGNNWLEAH